MVHSPRVIQHDCRQVLTGLGEVGHGQAEGGQKATLRADTGQSGYLSGYESASAQHPLPSASDGQWDAYTHMNANTLQMRASWALIHQKPPFKKKMYLFIYFTAWPLFPLPPLLPVPYSHPPSPQFTPWFRFGKGHVFHDKTWHIKMQ